MNVTIERTVLPTVLPITVAEAKAHCRVTHSAEDALFPLLIGAARDEAEQYMARTINLTTWQKTMDGFPASEEILLPYPRILALASFQYRDQTEEWVTVDETIYRLDTASKPGRLYLKWDKSWPSDLDYTRQGSVRLAYRAGYVDSEEAAAVQAAVPVSVKQWIMVRTATLYENRETFITGTIVAPTPGINGLLDPHRVLNLGI
jgi:uncharacterized phiE125 gp8 family phage protein